MAALGSTAALFDNKKKFASKSNFTSANRYAKVKVKKIIVYKTLGDNKVTEAA